MNWGWGTEDEHRMPSSVAPGRLPSGDNVVGTMKLPRDLVPAPAFLMLCSSQICVSVLTITCKGGQGPGSVGRGRF